MATNHHPHHQCHCLPTPPPTTTCYCTMCCTTTHYPPPPPQPPSNPLIHSISSHHHHQYHHTPPQLHQHAPPQTHHYPPHIHQHAPPQTHHNLHTQHHNHYPPSSPPQEPTPPITPTVSSLIHRIAALETSLRRRKQSQSSSLRDAAARTIQTHFRAFLVRRSVTLRHLKQLAYIKSALNLIKSSVPNKTQFDSHTLYRESMNLLIKLESLQGNDPMIRDGKRSISRELIRFMELIDEMCTERQVIAVKNVRFGKNVKKSGSRVLGYDERKVPEKLKILREYVNKVGERLDVEGKSEPKVKKNVRFDEEGNVYRLFKSNHKISDDEEVEEIGVCSKETEVDDEDESSEMSENEMDQRKNLRTRIHRITEKNRPDEEDDDGDDDGDDSFVFSAPLPAKMEY